MFHLGIEARVNLKFVSREILRFENLESDLRPSVESHDMCDIVFANAIQLEDPRLTKFRFDYLTYDTAIHN